MTVDVDQQFLVFRSKNREILISVVFRERETLATSTYYQNSPFLGPPFLHPFSAVKSFCLGGVKGGGVEASGEDVRKWKSGEVGEVRVCRGGESKRGCVGITEPV